jgi:hypothetical protein
METIKVGAMKSNPEAIVARIEELEAELSKELARRASMLGFGLEHGRVRFEEEVRRRHEKLRTSAWTYLLRANPLAVITAPFIYSLIFPLILLDLFLFLFQETCFRAYGIKPVKRRDFFSFDRQYLAYLNPIEKLNCAFCSYANGLLAYAGEIASLTERYWCPIKHARRLLGIHRRYRDFADYGDAEAYIVKSAENDSMTTRSK